MIGAVVQGIKSHLTQRIGSAVNFEFIALVCIK